MRRRYRKRALRKRAGIVLLVVVFLCGLAFVKLDARLRPIVQNYAIQVARRNAMIAVHSGVEQVLIEHPDCYDELITVTRNEQGQVLSAEANVASINLLKSQASQRVAQSLLERREQQVSIPLGTLLGGNFFTGRGPFLPLTIHMSGAVITTLRDDFTQAGINQTCHAIYLTMTIMVTVQLPLERQSFEMETEFLVSETVLVGAVPESYTHMHLEESDAATEIFDLNN